MPFLVLESVKVSTFFCTPVRSRRYASQIRQGDAGRAPSELDLPSFKTHSVYNFAQHLSPEPGLTLRNAAKTNKIGDGKIFVREIEEAIRIRAAEKGELAA